MFSDANTSSKGSHRLRTFSTFLVTAVPRTVRLRFGTASVGTIIFSSVSSERHDQSAENGVVYSLRSVFFTDHLICGVSDSGSNWHFDFVRRCGPYLYEESILFGLLQHVVVKASFSLGMTRELCPASLVRTTNLGKTLITPTRQGKAQLLLSM
ncbi:hypothetical protein QCA50_011315 [Cerrena zonata]|uniref:Uncharacterized protein n=1 Tax=Cerrena zonata TaxID=2478898 RepID=A0AAW0G6Y6_9APHY